MHVLPSGQDCKCEYLDKPQNGILPHYTDNLLQPEHIIKFSYPKHTIAHFSDENDTNLGSESGGLLCQLWLLRSSDPLLRRSLDGARVASVSPVIVSADPERLGISMCANGAKLSSTICRALW